MPISTANITTVKTSVYVSVGETAITYLNLCNYSAGNVLANIHVVPDGDTVSNNNIIITQLELTASGPGTGDSYQLYSGAEKLLLSDGDAVWIDASANSAVTAVTSFASI